MFASKHEWLLRWALHFCENDRSAAEDLVQECFVKLLLSWDSLRDVHNLEPVLYTYLKFAHLSERRRGRNYSFQNLSTIDFDTLAIRLRMANEADQLELQNELRRIVNYLLWRRQTAKYASIFLLRFFHGYFPDEIMRICMVTRHAVDLSLRYARQEIRSYLSKAGGIHESSPALPPPPQMRHSPMSAHRFAEELRQTIFESANDRCEPVERIRARYSGDVGYALDSQTLAHLACCKRCLDLVTQSLGMPPTSRRSPEDTLGSAAQMRGRGAASSARKLQGVNRAIAEGRRRLAEIRTHHASGLMLAVNGDILAVRDLNSEIATLKVETHSVETLKLVEVISEQGLTLLALPVLAVPPDAGPELAHSISMSGGRTISLAVRFTLDGALFEVVYKDPLYSTEPATGSLAEFDDALREADDAATGASNRPMVRKRRWGFFERLRALLSPASRPIWIFAALLLIAVLSFLHYGAQHRAPLRAGDVLRRAAVAELGPATANHAGVVHQQISILAGQTTLRRDLYRDAQRRRHPLRQPLTPEAQDIREMFAAAHVDWDEPLSATGYKTWRDHVKNPTDRLEQINSSLVLVSSTPDDPLIREESLTMRAGDLHPVARRIELRDRRVIEVAELSYSVMPWSKESERWFEPEDGLLPRTQPSLSVPGIRIPINLSEEQLNETELQLLLALKKLGADTERLEIERQPTGIVVKGVVDTDDRKRQISAALLAIAHVSSAIASYRDMDRARPDSESPSSLAVVTAASDISPMEQYCQENHIDRDDCRRASYQILNSATVIARESNQIQTLLKEYSPAAPLTPDAAKILDALLSQDAADIRSSLVQQEAALSSLQYTAPQSAVPASTLQISLTQAAQTDLGISKELLYPGVNPNRSTAEAMSDLAHSFTLIRTSLLHLPGVLPLSSHDSQSAIPQP